MFSVCPAAPYHEYALRKGKEKEHEDATKKKWILKLLTYFII